MGRHRTNPSISRSPHGQFVHASAGRCNVPDSGGRLSEWLLGLSLAKDEARTRVAISPPKNCDPLERGSGLVGGTRRRLLALGS